MTTSDVYDIYSRLDRTDLMYAIKIWMRYDSPEKDPMTKDEIEADINEKDSPYAPETNDKRCC